MNRLELQLSVAMGVTERDCDVRDESGVDFDERPPDEEQRERDQQAFSSDDFAKANNLDSEWRLSRI